jgi:hypothetical protein
MDSVLEILCCSFEFLKPWTVNKIKNEKHSVSKCDAPSSETHVTQWRTKGGVGVFNPPPRNSDDPPKLCQTQPVLRKLLKIAEFRTPTPQDVREKGSKILKLPRFAIALH